MCISNQQFCQILARRRRTYRRCVCCNITAYLYYYSWFLTLFPLTVCRITSNTIKMTQKRQNKQTAAKQIAKKARKEPTPDPDPLEKPTKKPPKKGGKSIYICKNMVPKQYKNMISPKVSKAVYVFIYKTLTVA